MTLPDCCNFKILKVAIDVDDSEESSGAHDDHEHITEHTTLKLVIVSDLPLPYWAGTVAIARLGSHAAGVFVTITDAGRRLLIEARDFEAGPLLATSMVPLEAWTGKKTISVIQKRTRWGKTVHPFCGSVLLVLGALTSRAGGCTLKIESPC